MIRSGHVESEGLHSPLDRELQGASSYTNYLLNRDSRPENVQPVIVKKRLMC